MDGQLVTVSTEVFDRQHRIRWAVAATFASIDGSEPRCVDYRVRVVPFGTGVSSVFALHQTISAMESGAAGPADVEAMGEIPAEGIPRYVFEKASQSRLLEKARASIAKRPERFDAGTRSALQRVPVSRSGQVRRGRPTSRPLGEKLRILRDVEDAYRTPGRSRADVAAQHLMSESSLRDLLTWARHVAEPPLFTGLPGKREGRMTPAARRMLEDGVEE
jgi:hypothetical protein